MAHEVPGLASVIFGRTKYADVWWRAVPTGMPVNGWLTDTVHAAFASGLSLDEGPRFLLAATAGYRLVGVACRAAELSKRFNADPRPLSCFVGWLSDSDRTVNDRPARLPSLSELRAHYVKWAGSDYDRYVRDVWDADIDVAGKPVLSVPAPPPWPGTAGSLTLRGTSPATRSRPGTPQSVSRLRRAARCSARSGSRTPSGRQDWSPQACLPWSPAGHGPARRCSSIAASPAPPM